MLLCAIQLQDISGAGTRIRWEKRSEIFNTRPRTNMGDSDKGKSNQEETVVQAFGWYGEIMYHPTQFYQIITYIWVPMRCARTAVGQCTDRSPWVPLCGEELFKLSVFSTAFVTVSLFVFLFCFFFFVDELHQVSSGFMPEFLGCCDVSLCSAEQMTS